jgi:hypothetical protein
MATSRPAAITRREVNVGDFTSSHYRTAARRDLRRGGRRPAAVGTPPCRRPARLAVWLLAGFAAGCGGLAGSEELTFTDRSEAVSRVEPGVARVLPASATTIRQRRNLATGRVWARFDFAPGERQTIASACEAQASGLTAPAAQAPGLAWWPDMLATDLAAADEQFLFFHCRPPEGPSGWLALHRTVAMAVYWEPGGSSAR